MKTIHDPSNKPYYKCLLCPKFRHICAGLPTRDMTLPEWCEMIRDVMDYFHITIAYVAKEAPVSESTVEKIKAGTLCGDIMRATERGIERAVLGCVGNYTCYLDHDDATSDRIAKLEAELSVVKEELVRERKENDRKAKIIDKYLDA